MELGKIFIAIGLGLVVVGGILLFTPKGINPISWFGKLPGDISYSSEHSQIFIPITSMLLLSVVVSGVSWLIQRIFK